MGGPFLLYSGCNNRRVFDERDLKWIQDLVCLKKCGMSIQEMKAYLDLCLQGPATIPQRKEMLTQKQEALRRTIQELEGDEGQKHLEEYADANTERGQCMLKAICEKMGFDSLGYQSLDGLLESIGLDRDKVCTYCWNGKE